MAIIPGPGYMVDPNNPNGVIPIGSQSTINNPNAGYQFSGSTAPASPTPTATQTPVQAPPQTPTPNVTINNNTTPPQQAQPKTQATGQSLAMPSNGSVVDLLNAAGTDSSFQNRQQLAQQYGIQGYQGTAAQNQELSKKFLEAFNAKKSTPVPQTSADARSDLTSYFQDTPQQEDPQKSFFDQYMQMNPVVKTLYDTINNELSHPVTQQSFKDEYAKLQTEQGIPQLQTDFLNIKNIMDGTEDDIRTEITKAGGFATDSQVQALTATRNKVLLKQAKSLQDQLIMKEDYVDRLMDFSKLDRDQVNKELDRKLGLTEKLANIQDKITSAARENYQKVVDKVGYNGLAQALAGDKAGLSLAETSLGLPQGILSNPNALKALTPIGDDHYQFISGTENQASGVFDKTTGKFTRMGGGGSGSAGGGGIMGGIGSATNADGTPKTPIQRDADSVMAGVLNLQDISTKDNYRAQVSAELNKRFNDAKASGDIYGTMKASAVFDKEPGDTFITSMEKLTTTLGQIGVLQENIQGTNTGPLVGLFRGNNPWDTNAQTIKAQLNAIVPNLARGVYGEVGVLTDNDIKNYAKTLPNLTSTEAVRNAVLYITVDMIRRNAESKIANQAAGQRDMSGYANVYKGLVDETAKIKSSITGGVKKGKLSDGTVVSQLPNGVIVDAAGTIYDQQGNRMNWGAIQLTK